MRDYAVLVRERGPQRLPDYAVVPYGFSWGAFLFQALWALYRGVWLTAIALLLIGLAVQVVVAMAGLPPASAFAMELGAAVVMGLAGPHLRLLELGRRGFRLIDIVAARSLAEAEGAGIRRHVEQSVDRAVDDTGISWPAGLQGAGNRSI